MTQSPKTPLHRLLRAAVIALPLGLVLPAAALAQSPFATVARVNDTIVTAYEVEQRALFLEVVRAPGDLRAQAFETLVNERLQVAEARRLGIAPTPDEITAGIAEFAARANLSSEEFMAAIAEEGVAPETFRDFVANGIAWRNVVQTRFGARARGEITDAAVARALELTPRLDAARVLLAEIIVPIVPENQEILRGELERLMGELNFDTESFSQAATQFSAAASRENGGLTEWRPLGEIPQQLRQELVLLSVGEIYGPVHLGQAMGIFQMRGLSEGTQSTPPIASIDYATLVLPPFSTEAGQAAAAALRADVDQCDDLYGQRAGGFERVDQAPGAIPTDIALALAGLDAGEIAFGLTRDGGAASLAVMLCGRTVATEADQIEAVRQQIFAERLDAYANALLEELRAAAIISFP